MELGKCCLSLTVKDIETSKAFYEKLGFVPMEGCGSVAEKWLILKNSQTMIGLFEGMFEHNILTFQSDDVRAFQAHLKESEIQLDKEADEGDGPAHVMFRDPDDNQIMLEQF